MNMNTNEKLQALREQLKEHKLDGYVQPLSDEFMSEYPPACYRRVEWLTGFSGSAGTAVVLADKAAFFTDGRYTLQAQAEVDSSLFEQHNSADVGSAAWVSYQLSEGRIGYDPKLFTRDMLSRMQKSIGAVELVAVDNLVDAIWKDRPQAPATDVFVHDEQYNGESSSSKRARIAEAIKKAGAECAVIAAPDSVCWLLNIRARDVESTPLLLAPLIIDETGQVQLFVDAARVNAKTAAHLGNEVSLVEPDALADSLSALANNKKRVLCDPSSVPLWYIRQLDGALIVDGNDPCTLPKATKNAAEIQSTRNAHRRDGVAVTKLLHWLETQSQPVTEMDVEKQLQSFREQVDGFVESSFNTIAGSGPNGAIVHYRASKKTNRTLGTGELFLLDSGGQYPDGTTDITRTVAVGAPSAEHKEHFTRVLKGHIAVATAIFPKGTAGSQLDTLARQYLWEAGLDYDHGTGHGVGLFLGVHEGPQRISKRGGDVALAEGMVLSNEPGYYKTGAYGIRIENLVVVRTSDMAGDRSMLCFDTITCAPIDTRLVDVDMLTEKEKTWLNAYHGWVLETLLSSMSSEEGEWLKARCAAI